MELVTAVKEKVVRVPTEAVVERFGVNYVFIVADGHAQRRKVITGLEVDGVYEIVQGLKNAETIVIRGQTLLEDGSRIRVIDTAKSLSDTSGGE